MPFFMYYYFIIWQLSLTSTSIYNLYFYFIRSDNCLRKEYCWDTALNCTWPTISGKTLNTFALLSTLSLYLAYFPLLTLLWYIMKLILCAIQIIKTTGVVDRCAANLRILIESYLVDTWEWRRRGFYKMRWTYFRIKN